MSEEMTLSEMRSRIEEINAETDRLKEQRDQQRATEKAVRGMLALALYLPTSLLGAYAAHKVWAWHLTEFLGAAPSVIEAWAALLLVSLVRGYKVSKNDPLEVMVGYAGVYGLLLGVGWLLTLV